jgi:CheY-like chemotaxis protein
MRILLIEDNRLQAEYIERTLESGFVRLSLGRISTEHEFRSEASKIAEDPPDVILLDVMLRWTDPAPESEMPPRPDDVVAGGSQRAGLRCLRVLSSDARLATIPVILYTVLARADLEGEMENSVKVEYLPKEAEAQSLIEKITQVLRDRRKSENLPSGT